MDWRRITFYSCIVFVTAWLTSTLAGALAFNIAMGVY